MVEAIKLKEENNKKMKKNAETRMAVHTHTHTILSFRKEKNKVCRFVKFNNKIRDRTIQEYSIGLSFCVLYKHTEDRAGP